MSDQPMPDAELIARARAGDADAYSELWCRHSRQAYRAAHSFRELAEPDDLVAEAFTQILVTLRSGSGPTTSFRPYLYTVIRNLAIQTGKQRPRYSEVELDELPGEPPAKPMLEHAPLVQAFHSLSDRWQTVLWYTEVEGMKPAQVAVILGLSANGVSALRLRARVALRASWLQAHVRATGMPRECRTTLSHVGVHLMGLLGARESAAVASHLEHCEDCRQVVAELGTLMSRSLVVLVLLVAGLTLTRLWTSAAPNPPAPTAAARRARPRLPRARVGHAAKVVSVVATVAGVAALAGVGALAFSDAAARWPEGTRDASSQTSAPRPPAPGPAAGSAVDEPGPDPTARPVVDHDPTQDGGILTLTVMPMPALISTTEYTFSGTGTPASTVVARLSGERVCSVRVASSGRWACAASALRQGVNVLAFTELLAGRSARSVTARVGVDSIAPAAPTVTDTWTNAMGAKPGFAGTAEARSTITLSTLGGTILGTARADADGDWSVVGLAGLTPGMTSLAVTATDAAGNRSSATVPGPFRFAPRLEAPLDAATYPGGSVPFRVVGWPGETVRVELTGAIPSEIVLGASGTFESRLPTSAGSLTPGTYVVGVSYLDAGGNPIGSQESASFTVE